MPPDHAELIHSLSTSTFKPTDEERAALERCFDRAFGLHGGARRVRSLLFAWHNATELGGFDLSDLFAMDEDYLRDALAVINLIGRGPMGWYPPEYGYRRHMEALIEQFGSSKAKPRKRVRK